MGKSINTEIWKDHLYSYWRKHDETKIKALDSVDWNVRSAPLNIFGRSSL